ncbi:two-component system, NtrC family, C4-dicarboxylate transport sensor histidine kinase DctB [Roseateles sp. YR242]|uniref:sensor histidine kinase n=1 Tax=Roseateles sp. YR242 TaxID=1855305 RepID=UPI0008C86100|nr:ATP-binding protein [Roseateles sp. YR242]SEL67939.1 two-component system, NtrC family, C4-dicarboxylate transport sensor histidine kinase DctB [Roseateles sp. YR242]
MFSLSTFRQRASLHLSRPSFYLYFTGVLMMLGLVLGHRLSERASLDQLSALATERLELYAANLSTELSRHAYLPSLLAIDDSVGRLMQAPDNEALRHQVSQSLARVSVRAGTTQIFVADADGQVLAASEPLLPPSRLSQAISQDRHHFFAADASPVDGQATGSINFFLLQTVRRQQRLLGVIVVKLNLAPLEATWVDLGLRSQGERILVADDQGVVIMSSVQAWKYAVLSEADATQRDLLQASARYPQAVGPNLGLPAVLEAYNSMLVQAPAPANTTVLAQERQLLPLGLRLLALSDLTEVRRQARLAAWSGAAFGAAIGMLLLYLAARRRAVRQLFLAKAELQDAHARLERTVDDRTAELRHSNEALKEQITQREQTEGELLQASKLAVLGQMSAGLSHEVNQPLTALRALARNAQRLLEAGRTQAVADNLRSMDEMVERMGRITRQLKSFARKAERVDGASPLLTSVRNAYLLLEHRTQGLALWFDVDVPEGLRVRAEANRLEQVLVNLFANALDAMLQDAEPEAEPGREMRLRVCIESLESGQRVLIKVQDSGPGLDEALLPRLFEPFFTTKPAGEGLGLGLVISSKIVHEFGGTLRARRLDPGMSLEFDLAVDTWDAEETVHV